MSKRRVVPVVAWVVALVILATACKSAKTGAPAATPTGGTFTVESMEPGSLDPPLASGSEDARVERNLFDGLVRYDDKTAAVTPAVATSWDTNSDNTKFTFHLRSGTKFSNGEDVTAESFVRGMTRSLTPKLYNDPNGLGYHLDGIKGAADVSKGVTTTLTGAIARDKTTLEVDLSAPDAEFVVRAGHMPFFPIPSDAAMAAQKPSWSENPIGNGPFKMKEAWVHQQSITLVPNSTYYGTKPRVDQVLFKIFPDPDTSYLQWQAGNLDWTRLPPAKIPEAKAQNPGNYIIQDVGGINYLATRYTLAPTSNKLFDQAISLSFDRQAISNAVFSGLNTPAAGIVPPLIPGSRSKGTSGPCKYCSYDPARAQALFKQFKDGGGTVKEPFPMYFNAGAGHDAWMQAIANQIQTTLGFKVQAIAATSQFTGAESYTKFIGKDAPASANRLGWSLDYPTPDNFLYPLFSTGSPDNKAQYSNPTFDALIKQARAEPDATKRVKIYQQAEDIVLEDLPIIPVWWRTQIRLAKLNKWGGLGMDPYEDPTVRTVYLKAASS